MAITEVANAPWTRKHDLPGVPLLPAASRIAYPKSLEELIEMCATRRPGERFRAAGSHWALSEAAISDHTFIETHDPNDLIRVMGRTLFEVVPGCLNRSMLDLLGSRFPRPYNAQTADLNEGTYFVHFETGKTVYQLYSELDEGDDNNRRSLAWFVQDNYGNSSYMGPWAFETLGGAGGQTVFGALTTGTHGGDIHLPPIADSVMAMHLVADGGKHYWIEPQTTRLDVRLTDDDKLTALYGDPRYGGRQNFEIIRDDAMFDAVLVSAGRFGVVYSVVLRAVRQYSLREERHLDDWQNVRQQISDTSSALYTQGGPGMNRFLQVAVCLTPYANFQKNRCGVTKRWNVPLASAPGSATPSGRAERRGPIVDPFDNRIQAPRFEWAGNSDGFSPDPTNPGRALPPSFLERACANGNFMVGIIESVLVEIREFISNNKVAVGGVMAAVAAFGPGGLLALIPALIVIAAILAAFLALLAVTVDSRLGSTLNDLKDQLLNRPDPAERAAGLFVWQCIALKLFEREQGRHAYSAISYAVMDGHNYLDKSCNVNVDSIEVFFDATDPMLVAFVDALIAFEIRQEFRGRAIVGYVSLRFTARTRALLGMQRFPVSCAVEVAGLKDVTGTTELIDFAIALSRDRNFRGILHWGQRNPSTAADIEFRFGDDLRVWREALARITDNGRLDGFSSGFTRRVGLEVV